MNNFLLIIIFCIKTITNDSKCLLDDSNKKRFSIIELGNFDNLNQLNFSCNNETLFPSFIEIKPNRKLVLNNSLNFNGSIILPKNNVFSIMLNNFKGFEIQQNPFKYIQFINYKFYDIVLNVKNSNFDFYHNNLNFFCNESYLIDDIPISNVFSNKFIILHESTLFSRRICPIIFKDAYVFILSLRVSLSFINKNDLKFVLFKNLSKIHSNNLNASIFLLDLTLYHNDLTTEMIDELVFFKLVQLDLTGQISNIQDDFFKYFKNLQILRIRTQNVRSIFGNKNKWLESINYHIPDSNMNEINSFDINLVFILVLYQTFENFTFYDYPEEDFCFYNKFPHQRFVLPQLKHARKSSCSCTEIFLIQYSYKFSNEIKQYTEYSSGNNYYQLEYYSFNILRENFPFSQCVNYSIEKIIEKCNFAQRLANCEIKSIKNEDKFYFYINDWKILSKYGKYYISLYVSPIISFFAIIMNILLLKVLSNDKLFQKKSERIYRYLKMNSYFNIIYIIITSFKLMTNCNNNDLFCSSIYDSIYVKYFNVIFIKLIGKSLQTAINISHISFTLSRYITITQTKSKSLLLFNKITIKMYLFIVLLISILINLYIYFEFEFEYSRGIDSYHYQDYHLFKDHFSDFEFKILNILQYFKIFVSDILYLIISFTIDIILITYVRRKVSLKKRLFPINALIKNIINSSNHDDVVSKKTTNMTSSKRITGMIVLNGINFLVFRFPLALISLYGLIYYFDSNKITHYKPDIASFIICRAYRLCDTIEEFLFIIYLISFFIQFYIFYKYDLNFKESFKLLKSNSILN
jgi:hypothetical protein